ncbi:hypothetical protein SBOR_6479 [Sclerotinia borealis F-4128]|uniref:Uncharacterized protein n=1 Tax=Sclerotinia borealis (strain F-4128) TaxID=1432307 RepID=W9C8R9_SCLBF|nr:hypothetical protein SBOR_6479 [Sclerotinia borealis F-4128]
MAKKESKLKYLADTYPDNLLYWPTADEMTGHNDQDRRKYLETLNFNYLMRLGSGNYERLFPNYGPINTMRSLETRIYKVRRDLKKLLAKNEAALGLDKATILARQVQRRQAQARAQARDRPRVQAAASSLVPNQQQQQQQVDHTHSNPPSSSYMPRTSAPRPPHSNSHPSAQNLSTIPPQAGVHPPTPSPPSHPQPQPSNNRSQPRQRRNFPTSSDVAAYYSARELAPPGRLIRAYQPTSTFTDVDQAYEDTQTRAQTGDSSQSPRGRSYGANQRMPFPLPASPHPAFEPPAAAEREILQNGRDTSLEPPRHPTPSQIPPSGPEHRANLGSLTSNTAGNQSPADSGRSRVQHSERSLDGLVRRIQAQHNSLPQRLTPTQQVAQQQLHRDPRLPPRNAQGRHPLPTSPVPGLSTPLPTPSLSILPPPTHTTHLQPPPPRIPATAPATATPNPPPPPSKTPTTTPLENWRIISPINHQPPTSNRRPTMCPQSASQVAEPALDLDSDLDDMERDAVDLYCAVFESSNGSSRGD